MPFTLLPDQQVGNARPFQNNRFEVNPMQIDNTLSIKGKRDLINSVLEPLTSVEAFKSRFLQNTGDSMAEADVADPVKWLTALTEEMIKNINKDKYNNLFNALNFKNPQSFLKWKSPQVWDEYIEYCKDLVRNTSYGLVLVPTNINTRKECLIRLFSGNLKLLWLNLGAVNEAVWDINTVSSLATSLRKHKPKVIASFGWEHISPEMEFDDKQIKNLIKKRNVLQTIASYGKENKEKTLLIVLRERMENHFVLSVNKNLAEKTVATLMFEYLHSEDQQRRDTYFLESPTAKLFEIGIITKHLLREPIVEPESERGSPDSYWIRF
ncbi:MAG: hypothetical protein P9M14_15200 [Candidatus Alcyoniella australis]|nr:hypothetical protein [Candidatus Alcyoniella australis]